MWQSGNTMIVFFPGAKSILLPSIRAGCIMAFIM